MYTLRNAARAAKRNGAAVTADFAGDDSIIREDAWAARRTTGPFPQFPKVEAPEIAAILWRNKSWIILAGVLGAVAGLAYGTLATPRHTASTDLLIAPAGLQVMANDVYAQSLQSDSQLLDIESKMRVVTSGNVLRRVADALDLRNDPEFAGKKPWFDIRKFLGIAPDNAGDLDTAVLRELSEHVTVGRQERSYLVTASVWTEDPEKSVRIANALTDAFKAELAQADGDGASRATKTISDRLNELKASVAEAEDQVAAFRRNNNLQQSAAGKLVSTQSMEQINGKLVDAQSKLIDAESRYRQLTEAKFGDPTKSSILQSETLTALRVQYASLNRQIASMSLTYGPRHPSLTNARSELASLERDMSEETARILRSAKTDLDQARAVMKSLSADNKSMRNTVSDDDDAQVKLRELERAASAKAAVYQAFLVRASEAAERQQVDATNIRVVSTAIPPKRRSWPPRNAVMAGAGFVGGAGFGAALILGLALMGAWRQTWRTN